MLENSESSLEPKTVETPPVEKPKRGGFFKEVIKFVLFVVLVLVPIRFLVAQPFIVVGTSMEPTFSGGEYLIVDELSYHFENPSRGDVVIFRPPVDEKVFYIKRVIGLPNETVELKNDKVIIRNSAHPEGFTLDESYIKYNNSRNSITKLGPDQYFVMGDNRPVSFDSRSWGAVPRGLIVGRAFLRLLPPDRLSLLPGSANIIEAK